VPYVVNAHWTSTPGHEGVVADALKHLTVETKSEPGNLFYQVYQDPERPLEFHIFEMYDDEAAFQAHAQSDHFARYGLGQAIPLLASREREFYWTVDA
jgi:quinol monooxygenase YgiN